MGITAFLLIIAIQFAEGNAHLKRSGGMDCLSCQRVAQAHDCQTVITCNEDEECFTEEYATPQGHIFVDLGCKPKSACDALNNFGRRSQSEPQKRQSDGRITLCQQCCNGTMSCNSKACDTYNRTGRICYTCEDEHVVENASDCEKITMCGVHEQCYSSLVLTDMFEQRSRLGCISTKRCAWVSQEANVVSSRSSADPNLPIVLRKSIKQSGSRIWRQDQDFLEPCIYCCNQDYCNKQECQVGSTPVTPNPVAITTRMVSTATITPTALSTTTTTTRPSSTSSSSGASTATHPSTTHKSTAAFTTMLLSTGTSTLIHTLSTSRMTAPPTLNTTIASTTLQPSTMCVVCSPQSCSNQMCEGATPYCLNVLNNKADGNKQEEKRCGSELECERDWYNKTALSDICSIYEPWQLYESNFSCTYCCVRNYCNRGTNPPRETLYSPKNPHS